MIRSAKVYFKRDLNDGKLARLDAFLKEYRRVAKFYLDALWNNPVVYNGKTLSIKDDKLDVPMFLCKAQTPVVQTSLSARALKCCINQVLGAISSVVEERRVALWIKAKREEKKQELYPSLLETLTRKPTKPKVDVLNPELNSICVDFQETKGAFNGFLNLKSLGKQFGRIRIPVKYHRQLLKWKDGTLKNSFLVSKDYAVFRYEIKRTKKTSGDIVGADTGLKTVVTLSNGTSTPKQDSHGHSLESIVNKVARKKKGSNNSFKAQEHRKNFIGWSINQLNFRGIKQINLEDVVNINFGRRASRTMQAWTNAVIRDKVVSLAEEQEVLVVLQDSTYRSQRCSSCGLVRKANRKGEVYSCKHCDNVMNADLNAAKNHEISLPDVPYELRRSRRNLKGFFWEPRSFRDFGTELTVPTSKKKEN